MIQREKKWPDTLFQLYGQTKVNDNLINISWEDLATMAFIAPETVSCTLFDFKDQQIIDRGFLSPYRSTIISTQPSGSMR